jgi:uncharacterized protein (UPF0248 family)
LWPTPLVDASQAYFFLIGIAAIPPTDLAEGRRLLREWQLEIKERLKGKFSVLEAKLISRKVFIEHGFEIYKPAKSEATEVQAEVPEPVPTPKTKKEKKKELGPPAGNFKKKKGSNPAEVRRQFLEHSMNVSGSHAPNPNSSSSGKLRPGKEVLNRMKYDERFDVSDFVVGYIDRQEGILEKKVQDWEPYGQEELMAYIRNVKTDEVVWDKVRKVDSVFGTKSTK